MSDSEWLKKSVERIESKVDAIDTKVDSQANILSAQAVTLSDHTRRSLAAEENIDILRSEVRVNKSDSDIKFSFYDKYIDRAKFVFVIIGFIAVIAELVGYVAKFF